MDLFFRLSVTMMKRKFDLFTGDDNDARHVLPGPEGWTNRGT